MSRASVDRTLRWARVVTALLGVSVVLVTSGCKRERGEGKPESAGAERGHAGVEVAAPAGAQPLALTVGQWTRHRVADRGSEYTRTLRVVGEEGGAFWFEVVSGAADAGTVVQVLMDPKDRRDPAQAEIRAAKVRMPNGFVKEVRGPLLGPSIPGYKSLLSDVFIPSLDGAAREDATVRAGTFHGCFRTSDATGTRLLHPRVPIDALVKSESADHAVSNELIDYGEKGAISEIEKRAR